VVLFCVFMLATPALAQSQAVWLIPIDTEITPATAQFVRSRVDRANSEQPLALVFLIDTPGGRVDAMSDIVDSILQRAQVPTISIVEDAFSAGALIAMSADQLAMLPGSSIGAALTVTLDFTSPNGMTAADEKINSATRSQFRSVAEATGRNTRVAEAMVDQGIEIPGLSTSEELVTLTPSQAVEYDIADLEASNINDALEQLGYAGVPIERLEMSTLERTGTFLTSPLVAAALLAIGVIGLVVEFFTPGLGLPGGIGVLALLLFFSGAFIATPATNVDVAIAALGILLIAAELFVIPGFGIAGILGIAALGFSLFRIFEGDAVNVIAYSTVFTGVLLVLALWLLPNARLTGFLTLSTRLTGSGNQPDLGTATLNPIATTSAHSLLHKTGTALTDLRPAGVAVFGDTRVDVVTEGDYISAGSNVMVYNVYGNRVVVRQAAAEA
jgi:membrane-bound serine protease (ClpP class)